MITTVVFDLDDTLYDEIDYCRSGFAAVADYLGAIPDNPSSESIFEALWQQFTAGNRTRTFNAALEKLGLPCQDNLIEELVSVYRNHKPTITLPAESRETLHKLSRKYILGLLTDGYLPAQRLKVEALGIEQFFRCIIYTEQLGREFWKPSPAGFQKLLDSIGQRPENMVYVADNALKDFIAPNRLGAVTIQITRPRRLHRESADQQDGVPKYKISTISQLPALLERI